MRREDKVKSVEELKERVGSNEAVIFTEITGMKVSDMNAVRAQIRENGGLFKVYKRSLALRSLSELGINDPGDKLEGPTAYCFPGEDIPGCAKRLVNLRKERPKLLIKGGLMKGAVIDTARVEEWARLPEPDVIRAQAVGALAAPIYGFCWALSGLLGGLVRVLDAHKNALEAGASQE